VPEEYAAAGGLSTRLDATAPSTIFSLRSTNQDLFKRDVPPVTQAPTGKTSIFP
jgi:hypothetical protein